MRLAWLSDIHLNFVRDVASGKFDESYETLCGQVRDANADAVVITGDIAEAPEFEFYLERLAEDLPPAPIYFVLGNHDYYRGSIAAGRVATREFCEARERFHYLTAAREPVRLTPETSLVGHDGWADGRYGAYSWSEVRIADYDYIDELKGLSKEERLVRLNQFGDEGAEHLRGQLAIACESARRVVVLTHVPPFLDACLYRGKISSPEWAPHFSCLAIGKVLIEVATAHPGQQFTVLCGHTHSAATFRPKANLEVFAAEAEYGFPVVQRTLEVA